MRMDIRSMEKRLSSLLSRSDNIFLWLGIILFFAYAQQLYVKKQAVYEPPAGVYESICIPAETSEQVIQHDMIVRNGKYYPIVGDEREGCLILFSLYAFDLDGDGHKDKGAEYARYVDDDYDTCCITGE